MTAPAIRARRVRSLLARHPALLIVGPTAVLAAVVAVGLGAAATTAPDPGRTGPSGGVGLVQQHRVSPAFSRPLLLGPGQARVRAHPGRVTVLTFWASWCTACRAEATALRRMSARYQPLGVRFLGIDHEDRRSAARSFARRYDLGYPSVTDPDGNLLSAYRGVGLPSTFVLDRAGVVRFAAAGSVDPAALGAGLDRLLARSAG